MDATKAGGTPVTVGGIRTAGLDVVDLAIETAGAVHELVRGIRGHSDLVDQVTRATESVALNLAEGAGRAGKDRRYHFGVAYGSAGEAMAAIRILLAYRVADEERAGSVLGRLDRIRAIAWTLGHR